VTEENVDSAEEPEEMRSPWSNKHWRRLKRVIGAEIGLFVLVVIAVVAVAIEAPANEETSPADTPIAFSLTVIWFFFTLAVPFLISYFISRDKAELNKYLKGIEQRSTGIILIFNICTLLGYTLWYGYVRWRRLDQKVSRNEILGEPEEMRSPWSNKHWRRLKRVIGAEIGLFVLVVIAVAIEVPANGEASSADTPIAFSLTVIWLFFYTGNSISDFLLHQ
jgi:hypothetical protein